MGRPAKHLYGLSRVSRSLVVRPNLNLLSRDAIQRRVPIQKLMAVNPPAIHSNRSRLPTGVPVFCGRAVGAESPNCFSIPFRWLVMIRELKRAGTKASPLARGPAVG
jgi:hypothetical protein